MYLFYVSILSQMVWKGLIIFKRVHMKKVHSSLNLSCIGQLNESLYLKMMRLTLQLICSCEDFLIRTRFIIDFYKLSLELRCFLLRSLPCRLS